jgi:hypothetical protein
MAKKRNSTHRPWTHVNGETREFPTYRGLVKALPELLKEEQKLTALLVTRQLRGEFGQRFEYWEMFEGKPKIIKEGWY